MIRDRFFIVIAILFLMTWQCRTVAQIKGNEITVMVSPDHDDRNYGLGEKCEFTVSVYKAQNLLRDVVIDYELGPVMYADVKKENVRLKDGACRLTGRMDKPGYYRCKVRAHSGGRTYEGLATVAFAPEKIEAAAQMPTDFKAYWERNISQARQTPLDSRMRLLPERCTDNSTSFYYRRVVLGVIRAIDFIDQLPQYNHKALGVTGSSQGGALSIMAAGLDSRVTCYAAVHPALCDHEAFLKGRAGGWPHYYYYNTKPSDKTIENIRHYDVVNFARCITVPGWFSWGYNDEVCPPTSMQAAYNAVKAPKEFKPYLQTGHYWYQEQWDEWCEWIWNKLGIYE